MAKAPNNSTKRESANHTTRRVPAKQLSELKMWWEGPQLLFNVKPNLPNQPEVFQSTEVKKELMRSERTLDSGTVPEPLGDENDLLHDRNRAVKEANRQIFP